MKRWQNSLRKFVGKIPLRVVFILPFVVQIVVIVGLTGYLTYRNGQKAVESLITNLQGEISGRIESRLQLYLATPHLLNQVAANALQTNQLSWMDETTLMHYFWRNLQIYDELNATFLGTEEGMMVGARRLGEPSMEVMLADVSTGGDLNYYETDVYGHALALSDSAADYDPRLRAWYQDALAAGAASWSPIYLDFATGELVVTAALPVYDEVGAPMGVLGSAFQFKQVNQFLRDLNIGPQGQTFIMGRDGLLVATSSDAPISQRGDGGLVRLLVVDSMDQVERETAVALTRQFGSLAAIEQPQNLIVAIVGEDYYVRVTPISDEYGLDWLAVVAMPESAFMAEIVANNRMTMAAIVLALVMAMVTGVLTTRWVTRPLLRLRDSANALAEGSWDKRVAVDRQDELGQLSVAFNRMADLLQDSFGALQQSQARFESMFHAAPIMLWEEDMSGVRHYLDDLRRQGVADLAVYFEEHPEELVACARLIEVQGANKAKLQVFGPDPQLTEGAQVVFKEELLALDRGDTYFAAEFQAVRLDGSSFPMAMQLVIVPGHEQDWGRVILSAEDVTERRQMEDHLRQSEQRLKQAQHMAKMGDWEFDLQTGRTNWSDEMYVIFERPIELGPPDPHESAHYFLGEDADKLQRRVEQAIVLGQPLTDIYRVQKLSGQIVYVDSTLFPVADEDGRIVRLRGTFQDITERVALEKQVYDQERLAAVGQLAAGIAHDFNNILSSITLYTDLLIRGLPDLAAKDKHRLETISRQAERATHLIQQILDFSRRSPLMRMPGNVLQPLQDLVEILRHTLPENIETELIAEASSYVADIDPTHMQQVFMNLAVNARDAMPEGGKLTIAVQSCHFGPADVLPAPNMTPGNWVKIRVQDTGMGIRDDVVPRIFEPFFTTKGLQKGTGLGLAQVHGIITQHEGFITVESQLQVGTTFAIYLPQVVQLVQGVEDWTAVDMQPGQGELLLLVEDNEATREALLASLLVLNYEVVTAENGREALEFLQTNLERVNLVVSDMGMPEMNGLEMVTIMRQNQWSIPVVILSGYLLEEDLETLNQLTITGWLTKPPNLRQLALLIRRGLSGEPT
jgi:signal transduction histidine kinase/ActR/RegA family two-component response regulator